MKLKQLRIARGLSQEALAKKAGLSREYVTRLESDRHDPSLSTLTKLARALKVTLAELTD